MMSTLSSLTHQKISSLSGNGMHLPTVWAVFMYMMMNTVWLHDATPPVAEVPLGRRGGTRFFEEIVFDAEGMLKKPVTFDSG